jgi:hypothetical protein
MSKLVDGNEATPKGMPNSSRHDTETAVHDPKDQHQTAEANESARIDAAKNKKTGPGSHGERR